MTCGLCPHGNALPHIENGQQVVCFNCFDEHPNTVCARARKHMHNDLTIMARNIEELKAWGDPLRKDGWDIVVKVGWIMP